MNESSPPPHDEFEVRITAYLLGELDADQAAEIAERLQHEPELRQLADRLKKTIELLEVPFSEKDAAEPVPEFRFDSDRREALLAQLSAPPAPAEEPRRSSAIPWYMPIGIAASLALLLGGLMLGSLDSAKQAVGRADRRESLALRAVSELSRPETEWSSQSAKQPRAKEQEQLGRRLYRDGYGESTREKLNKGAQLAAPQPTASPTSGPAPQRGEVAGRVARGGRLAERDFAAVTLADQVDGRDASVNFFVEPRIQDDTVALQTYNFAIPDTAQFGDTNGDGATESRFGLAPNTVTAQTAPRPNIAPNESDAAPAPVSAGVRVAVTERFRQKNKSSNGRAVELRGIERAQTPAQTTTEAKTEALASKRIAAKKPATLGKPLVVDPLTGLPSSTPAPQSLSFALDVAADGEAAGGSRFGGVAGTAGVSEGIPTDAYFYDGNANGIANDPLQGTDGYGVGGGGMGGAGGMMAGAGYGGGAGGGGGGPGADINMLYAGVADGSQVMTAPRRSALQMEGQVDQLASVLDFESRTLGDTPTASTESLLGESVVRSDADGLVRGYAVVPLPAIPPVAKGMNDLNRNSNRDSQRGRSRVSGAIDPEPDITTWGLYKAPAEPPSSELSIAAGETDSKMAAIQLEGIDARWEEPEISGFGRSLSLQTESFGTQAPDIETNDKSTSDRGLQLPALGALFRSTNEDLSLEREVLSQNENAYDDFSRLDAITTLPESEPLPQIALRQLREEEQVVRHQVEDLLALHDDFGIDSKDLALGVDESLIESRAKNLELETRSRKLRSQTQLESIAEQLPESQEEITELKAELKVEPTPVSTPNFPQRTETRVEPTSTFSLNVSDVSFRLAAAALAQGQWPDSSTVRPEEFFNAFHYNDPQNASASPVSVHTERARYPLGHGQEMLRISVQTQATGRSGSTPLNLVVLLDRSGSMERIDRQFIVRRALETLVASLQDQDRISIISFARRPRLWADGLDRQAALETLANLDQMVPEGGTNLEAALEAAYRTAKKHYVDKGINRVILLTDGAANLGNTENETLREQVIRHRREGIALDGFGIGWEGYDDHRLESLTRNGDGRYAFLNDLSRVESDFREELTGALNVAAKNVKVQLTFNPERVTAYRQIGFAKHQLKKEDFRNNQVDAAELAAAEAGTALYLLDINANGQGPIASLSIRYQDPQTGVYEEQAWDVAYPSSAPALSAAPPAMQLATGAAVFAEWLAGIPYSQNVDLETVKSWISQSRQSFTLQPTVAQLESMILQAQSLAGSSGSNSR